jgi:hypothetical protein
LLVEAYENGRHPSARTKSDRSAQRAESRFCRCIARSRLNMHATGRDLFRQPAATRPAPTTELQDANADAMR